MRWKHDFTGYAYVALVAMAIVLGFQLLYLRD
jgi:hypothetical protein